MNSIRIVSILSLIALLFSGMVNAEQSLENGSQQVEHSVVFNSQ